MFDLTAQPHRRFNPLTGAWLVVSPHRALRPWQGQVEETAPEVLAEYDAGCYLCPNNQRAGAEINPAYQDVFVFDNDFAALQPDAPAGELNEADLLVVKSERGLCRVVCFSPNHGLTLARMATGDIKKIVDEWTRQYAELGALDFINYVQIFENRGAMMGCSNPHPHGQIWASESVPNEPAKEIRAQLQYSQQKQSCLLCDYLRLEQKHGERIVIANDSFTALVPFWAIHPYETMILSNQHRAALTELTADESLALADILKRLTVRYDKLFAVSFPYSMGFHQAPADGQDYSYLHLHAHFYPPLLRSATVRKFMVGFELLGSPQRDMTPEYVAGRLREV